MLLIPANIIQNISFCKFSEKNTIFWIKLRDCHILLIYGLKTVVTLQNKPADSTLLAAPAVRLL